MALDTAQVQHLFRKLEALDSIPSTTKEEEKEEEEEEEEEASKRKIDYRLRSNLSSKNHHL
jgi:hypothetical protein